MSRMKHMRGMKRGNYDYRMPDEEREVLDEPDLSDDDDGYAWDADRGGSLGNEDDEDDEGE